MYTALPGASLLRSRQATTRRRAMATTEAVETREAQLYIGGEWGDAAGGAAFDDHDPFTGEVVARVAAGGRDDARRAIDAAARAFAAGAHTPPAGAPRAL